MFTRSNSLSTRIEPHTVAIAITCLGSGTGFPGFPSADNAIVRFSMICNTVWPEFWRVLCTLPRHKNNNKCGAQSRRHRCAVQWGVGTETDRRPLVEGFWWWAQTEVVAPRARHWALAQARVEIAASRHANCMLAQWWAKRSRTLAAAKGGSIPLMVCAQRRRPCRPLDTAFQNVIFSTNWMFKIEIFVCTKLSNKID